MAVPKRKTGRARTHSRRSANDVAPVAAKSTCEHCGATKLPHYVCSNCGYYKGREVLVTE